MSILICGPKKAPKRLEILIILNIAKEKTHTFSSVVFLTVKLLILAYKNESEGKTASAVFLYFLHFRNNKKYTSQR